MLDFHRADLARLAARDRLRVLAPQRGKDFASNDYLGLANSPRLAAAIAAAVEEGVPVGSGAFVSPVPRRSGSSLRAHPPSYSNNGPSPVQGSV